MAALRGDKPKQHGNLEDISEDDSIFDLLAEREEVVNEKEFYERVDAFDLDFFVQGNSVEKVTDDIEYSLGGDIDVEVYEAMPKDDISVAETSTKVLNIFVFPLTCRKILGSVGRKFFFYFLSTFYMLISGQNCFLGLIFQQNY